MVLLMASVMLNYFIGLHINPVKGKSRSKHRKNNKHTYKKIFLFFAVLINLSVLVLFKSGIRGEGLPLGLSFYTFQVLSYLIDVYRGEIKREQSFVAFATYITMFPRLIMGPIVSYNEVEAQLHDRKFDAVGIQEGLKVFVLGLAAKVLLADRIGLLWREVQITGFESISTPMAWLGAVAYSLKLYFDFYGYSLMAIGLGRMLGFQLPDNFHNPYMARSVRDFYRRWHITLGRWFCKYVYIPLGGNRKGEVRTVCNLLAVWVLTAFWHGSTPNFFIWGGVLWLLIVLERQLERLSFVSRLKVLPHLYLWLVIPVTWMCFAITDLQQLQIYLGRMVGVVFGAIVRGGDWLQALQKYWYLFAVGIFACTPAMKKVFQYWKDKIIGMVILAGLLWLCVWRLTVEGNNPFMYFSF